MPVLVGKGLALLEPHGIDPARMRNSVLKRRNPFWVTGKLPGQSTLQASRIRRDAAFYL